MIQNISYPFIGFHKRHPEISIRTPEALPEPWPLTGLQSKFFMTNMLKCERGIYHSQMEADPRCKILGKLFL